MINTLEKRGLIGKRAHPSDGRANGLHASAEGITLLRQAEAAALALEDDVASNLTASERKTLIRLLRKVYQD
jgi:DNA-binding MarR family transcriptional regulator